MKLRSLLFVAAAGAAMGSASPAAAQDTGLAGLLLRFFSPDNPVVLQPNLANPAQSHDAHFRIQPAAQDVLRQINTGIATQLSTFPIGSSSAGFTYTFDEGLGVYNRSTQSFGPVFAERPQTAGKGKFTLGVNHQRNNWDSLDGKDLEAGDLQLFLTHEDTNDNANSLDLWFEGDIIKANLRVSLETNTTVLFANYGVTERFDLSVAVPYQDISLSASIDTEVERLATGTDPFVVHQFDAQGSTKNTYLESGTASGLGDLLIRGKYNFVRDAPVNLAAFVDLRLPTGDEDELLGSGATQTRLSLVAGGGPGRFSPRASLGYTFSSGGSDFTGELPNELYYSAGFDVVPHPRVTVTADFIGRTLIDGQRLVDEDRTFNFRFRTDPTVRTTTRQEVSSVTDNVSLLLGSAGVKVNPFGNLLLVGNVLFKLGSNGLQDDITPVFGIGYTF
jgi:hypothetical protein